MSKPVQVLLVEDNEADAELTAITLEDSKVSVDLTIASDGEQAIAILARQAPYNQVARPDLVLLDLNLPKRNGAEVLAAMRSDDNTKGIPVVVLTSSEAETDVVKSYKLGANCYVTKPVGLDAFQEIVRSVHNFWFQIVKIP